MPSVPQRRTLHFANLQEVIEDVKTLDERGYRTVGKWDLSQVCNHLADWMGFPVLGFPKAPFPISTLLWLLKVTVGKRQLQSILEKGEMGTGYSTMPETVHPPQGDHSKATERLREAIQRLKNHSGPIHPSPLFGAMDKETCVKLQLIHCSHHLSFLIPQ